MSYNWQSWCRLCAKYEYYDNEEFIPTTTVADLELIVQKYFLISISIPDYNNSICSECYQFLTTLEKYSVRCRNVDKMFTELAHNNQSLHLNDNDVHLIRYKYGVDFDEKEDINLIDIIKRTANNKLTNTGDLSSPVTFSIASNDKTQNQNQPTGKKKRGRPKKTNVSVELKIEQVESDIDVPDFNADDSNNDPSFEIDSKQCDDSIEPDDDDYDDDDDDCDEDDGDDIPNGDTSKRRKARCRKEKTLPMTCPVCNQVFTVQRLYDVHMKNEHPDVELPFPCSKCPKRFSTLLKVQRHEFVHLPDTEKLLHPCPYCDKRFSKAVNVQAHVRAIHIGDRPFICEECGKSFGTKGSLKEHQITHSNEFPFQCSHCPKKFKNLARLKTHADIHKDTVYVCPHCGLQLNTKRTLKMHMVVHSDQKKYKCQYCGNEYKRSKALKNHLILHTGLRPYTCPFCEKTFANGSNCRSHKKKAHPLELAALEASGEVTRATNIPKLEHLQPKKDMLNVQNNIEDVMETIQQDEIIIPTQLFN